VAGVPRHWPHVVDPTLMVSISSYLQFPGASVEFYVLIDTHSTAPQRVVLQDILYLFTRLLWGLK